MYRPLLLSGSSFLLVSSAIPADMMVESCLDPTLVLLARDLR